MAKISKRCYTHQANRCTHEWCVSEAALLESNPDMYKPQATPGAPETTWSNPWLREVDLARDGQ